MNSTTQLLEPEIRELINERKFVELRSALRGMDPADVGELLGELEATEAAIVFRLLHREEGAEAFAHLEPERQEELIEHLGDERALRVLEEMPPDDRVALLDELPAEAAARLITKLSPENRRVTQQILNYPDETVGRLMTPDYVRVRPEWKVSQAIDHIRQHGMDAETINWVFVIGDRLKLLDELPIRRLLLAAPDDTVESLCDGRLVSLNATDDREEAVRVMGRYDRTALPVVDAGGHLLGIVTFDDVADVAEEEATEDIQQLGGVAALDQSYMETGAGEMFKKRGGWLAALFIGQTVTVAVLSVFEKQIHAITALALFIPLVISCGGNSGSQAATLVTRALALDEVEPGDWFRIVRRELVSGVLLGATLGMLGVVTVLIWNSYRHAITTGQEAETVGHDAPVVLIALVISASVAGVVTWGTMVGSLLPLALKKLRLDPAVASTPLVATLMDTSGMLIYFGIAVLIFRQILH
ncbi:MAG: magnesium transporter [Phycisphaerales bacterium]|nr:magnesium transporter [Phycisphaerales bacterium]